jgi:hypothetical protein
MAENRRDQRYRAKIAAILWRGQEAMQLLTDDVSFRGVFFRTDMRAALRQLVRVSFTLPGGQDVSGHAMVVHIVPPGAANDGSERVPGVGVQFWGELAGRRSWDAFIQELTKDPSKLVAPPPGAPDPVRRSSSRFRVKLEVRLPDRPEMLALTTRDISEDGMSVATEANYPPGLKTRLVLVHPTTLETLPVDVIVRRRIEEKDFVGLGVEFLDKSKNMRAKILAFVRFIPREDEIEIEIVPDDDPQLA